MREWVQNKIHHHVHESRTFSKRPTWCKLKIAPICGTFTESGNHLIFGYSPQTLTTGLVKMLYPRNMKNICNKLWCDYNARTLNVSRKERYWKIESMHVGIKLLDQQGWTSDWDVTQWLPSPTMNDSGKDSVGEVYQNDSAFWMNTLSRKVLWEVLLGIFITEPDMRRSRIRGRWCPRTKRVLGRNGFTFWCHRHYWCTQKERGKKKTIRKAPNNSNIASILKKGVYMYGDAWTCDMQKKLHHRLSPIQSYKHIVNCTHLKCMIILLLCECDAMHEILNSFK